MAGELDPGLLSLEGLTHASQPLPAFQREATLSPHFFLCSPPKGRCLVSSPSLSLHTLRWETSVASLASTSTR